MSGGDVTSAGWQVTLCDPIWLASSHSNMACLQTAIPGYFTFSLSLCADCHLDENCRSALQENAVQLSLDMFALMASECTSLLRRDLVSSPSSSGPESGTSRDGELHAILPCLKVFSDWMTCHQTLWNPPPLPLDPQLGLVVTAVMYDGT